MNKQTVKNRRSLPAILSGIAVMLFGILFVAVTIAYFFNPIDPPFFPIMLTPFALLAAAAAYKQYKALFCCEPLAARAFHEFYFIIGGLLLFAGITNLFEDGLKNLHDRDAVMFCGGFILTGVLFLLAGYINYRQMKYRRQFLSPFTDTNTYTGRKIIGAAGMLGLTLFIAAPMSYSIYNEPVIEEHLSYEQLPYKHFPSDGSDYSYRRMYRGTIYCEFTITEEGFLRWIKSQERWEYCKPTDGEQIGYRIHFDKQNDDVMTGKGFTAGWGRWHGGRAVFDVTTNRAYYWTYY